jgi:ribosomal protein S18 acetylase RimI-like enzyme
MGCTIRTVSSFGDIKALIAIHNAVWKRSTGIIDLLAESSDCYLVHDTDDNRVVGYAFVQYDSKGGFLELNDIAVDPGFRKRSYGKQLMRHIMASCDQIKLCTRARRRRLVRFYANLGFRVEATIENYYSIQEDALRMYWTKGVSRSRKRE